MKSEKYDALILAGGKTDKFDSDRRPPVKGLLEIGGKTVVEYVLEALAGVGRVDRMVVLAPPAATPGTWSKLADKVIHTDDVLTANIAKGIDYIGPGGKFLLVSSDIPLITSAAIEDFISKCDSFDADIYYPIITKAAVETQFPGTKRTYIRLRDGTFTGGNIFIVDKESLIKNRDIGQRMFVFRKNPFKMARLLGLGFILKYILRLLTIKEVENKASQILNCRMRAVITDHASLGVDVDKQEDVDAFDLLLTDETASVMRKP